MNKSFLFFAFAAFALFACSDEGNSAPSYDHNKLCNEASVDPSKLPECLEGKWRLEGVWENEEKAQRDCTEIGTLILSLEGNKYTFDGGVWNIDYEMGNWSLEGKIITRDAGINAIDPFKTKGTVDIRNGGNEMWITSSESYSTFSLCGVSGQKEKYSWLGRS